MIAGSYQKTKKGWKGKLFTLLALIILIFFTINLSKSWQRSSQINQEIAGLEQEITSLEKGNLDLEELIKHLNSSAYIEEKARLDLGLKKEGEKVVVVNNSASQNYNSANKTMNEEAANQSTANPQKWWKYFFE